MEDRILQLYVDPVTRPSVNEQHVPPAKPFLFSTKTNERIYQTAHRRSISKQKFCAQSKPTFSCARCCPTIIQLPYRYVFPLQQSFALFFARHPLHFYHERALKKVLGEVRNDPQPFCCFEATYPLPKFGQKSRYSVACCTTVARSTLFCSHRRVEGFRVHLWQQAANRCIQKNARFDVENSFSAVLEFETTGQRWISPS